MNRTTFKIVLIFLALTFAGCAAKSVVPKPGKITLENAMRDVGYGLVEMRKAQGELRTGLIADEVTVTFNISAAGEDTNKLYVEVTPILTKPEIGGKVGGEIGSKYTAQRGNQIVIKLKNIMTADTSNISKKDHEITKLKNMVEFIKIQGSGPIYDQSTKEPVNK